MRSWIEAAVAAAIELVLGRLGSRVAEVVADRRVEQVGLLGHRPDDLAQRRELDPADVDVVDLDRARIDVVQPRHEVGRGRLARPRRADERDELTRVGDEVDVVEAEGRGLGGGLLRFAGRVGLVALCCEELHEGPGHAVR